MKISVDYDDTLADQTSVLLLLMNWKLGTDYRFENLEWDFFHKDPASEKAFWDLHNAYDSTYLRRAMPPVDPYAFPVIKELQRKGHVVEIVTRNASKSHESIKAWLFMHGLELKVRAMGRGRGDEKLRLNYDVFVDDNPALAETIRKHPTKRLIIFTRPWNMKLATGRNILRADDWLAVRKILLGLGA